MLFLLVCGRGKGLVPAPCSYPNASILQIPMSLKSLDWFKLVCVCVCVGIVSVVIMYLCIMIITVVPHKAVAEVSKIGNL